VTTTDVTADPFAAAFDDYHAKGWTGTLPLPYRKKKSPPPDFTGYDGIYPSYADLYTWAEDGPQNICQRMRADVIGIDVDAYGGKDGATTLQRCVQAFGALPATYMSTSRDDGISGIRYFRVPEGTKLLSSLPGIEFIQRHHRYAVVWPSLHPETGQAYRWVNEMTGEVDCDVPQVDDLPPLPPLWLDGLRDDRASSTKADLDSKQLEDVLHGFPVGTPCEHILKAAGKAVEGTSRHDAYNAAVLAVCRYARRGCPGGQTVLKRLHKAFVAEISAPGERATAGEAEAEWRRCLAGALALVVDDDQGTACVDAATTDWLNAEQTPPLADDEVERTSWWPKDLGPVLAGQDPEPEPEFLQRLDGVSLLYRGKVNGLIGESESGKTWVALLAVLQALRARQRVLYLDFEDTAPGIVARLRDMSASDADMAYLAYVGPDEDFGPNAKRDLRQAIADAPPDLIVLDGFNAAMTLLNYELTDNTDATKFSQELLKPLAATGACLVYVDHVPKNKENRGKGGIGAQAKRAMTTGCAVSVEVVEPFGRGMTGRLRLAVDKDRPGHVRAQALAAKAIGVAVLTSAADGAVTVEIERATSEQEEQDYQQLQIRQRLLKAAAAYGADGCSRTVMAADAGFKKTDRAKDDIDWLIDRGQLVQANASSANQHPKWMVNPDQDQVIWAL
jgi:hypothetical protein